MLKGHNGRQLIQFRNFSAKAGNRSLNNLVKKPKHWTLTVT